ncbi:Histone deacetylase 3 [Spraguea lophii 42_110]|uniref:histone deacetylase n=1 Tax=Spraguea lophii (strain 42_110) TaxID=1358809 RepID=S7W9G1_SPRLO|nr:Histone deacetylase 3 [Spraguea lophii 42_110]
MKIAYMYDKEVGNFFYGEDHPMKPHRVAITHTLVKNYGLDKHMDIIEPEILYDNNVFSVFHTKNYINTITNETLEPSDDCPCFPGLGIFSKRYSSATINCSKLLNEYDIAINWGGGLHHAKKEEPSGFCYFNDIVMGIQEILKYKERVLYIDIDIHHGDGVEEAFYHSDRVMTLSFHKFGEGYYPGTGDLFTNGDEEGLGYAVNVPLKNGIDDHSYHYVFKPIVDQAIKKFKPSAIVLQCGADSLAEDTLGCFNLSIQGHGECVKTVKSYNIPLLILGGGGYNIKNVSRAWVNETAIACDVQIKNEIDKNQYSAYFEPSQSLYPRLKKKYDNVNSKKYLDVVVNYNLELMDNY